MADIAMYHPLAETMSNPRNPQTTQNRSTEPAKRTYKDKKQHSPVRGEGRHEGESPTEEESYLPKARKVCTLPSWAGSITVGQVSDQSEKNQDQEHATGHCQCPQ